MFGISKGGVWRIRGGDECEVRNGSAGGHVKEHAVVHLVRISQADMDEFGVAERRGNCDLRVVLYDYVERQWTGVGGIFSSLAKGQA